MPVANINQLRELLREKFPGQAGQGLKSKSRSPGLWPSRLEHIDNLVSGGFPKGSLTEIVCAQPGCGSASLMRWLLEHTTQASRFSALIDGADSFDATHVNSTTLSRLLWIRCHSTAEAFKAADLLLRDGNVPFVMFDLVLNPKAELRRIPATTWYRFQRILEQTSTVCLVFTPWMMIAPARAPLQLNSRFSLPALDDEPEGVARKVHATQSNADGVHPSLNEAPKDVPALIAGQ